MPEDFPFMPGQSHDWLLFRIAKNKLFSALTLHNLCACLQEEACYPTK